MRLTPAQIQTIRDAVRGVFGPHSAVRLFGSRLDDARRGGDIDLLVELPATFPAGRAALEAKFSLLTRLERDLGPRKIDVVVAKPGDERAIVQHAQTSGVLL